MKPCAGLLAVSLAAAHVSFDFRQSHHQARARAVNRLENSRPLRSRGGGGPGGVVPLYGAQSTYLVDVTVGTPPQNLSLILAPDASDTWIPDAASSYCRGGGSKWCRWGSCEYIPSNSMSRGRNWNWNWNWI